MRTHCQRPLSFVFAILPLMAAAAQAAEDSFTDDYSAGLDRWRSYFEEGAWSGREGVLTSAGSASTTGRLAKIAPVADVLIEADVRFADSGRRNFGFILRAQDDKTCQVVRYYDARDALELLTYGRGKVAQQQSAATRLELKPGKWYRMKAAAAGDAIVAKMWPADSPAEPDWQLRVASPDARAGGVGLLVDDGSRVDFGPVRIAWGDAISALKRESAEAKAARLKLLQESLKLQVEPTPFVLRSAEGPRRRVLVRMTLNDRAEPVDGELEYAFGDHKGKRLLKAAEMAGGGFELLLPEPAAPTRLNVAFTASFGKRFEASAEVAPARQWTFYMTPHTHYDIGFTEPQPVVIDRLAADMNKAVQFCNQTADWPEESRYRWTVEVSSLFRNFAARHKPEEVARFIDWVRKDRIEICGYYLNMPTELVGHEELIRCLYYADELRRTYGITIDTVMINDVPGYAWPLPQLFNEFGIRRAAFRANSIRGQFLWYRPGAVERPFYWQGPAGHKLFVWYTDSYREGNFFRAPGLHEGEFLSIIRRNEQTGTKVDHIQLRMGGDNLPPDFNTSVNTRAWNEKYLWPRVVVATNREYLDRLEKKYGAAAPTHRGDIPSWWAEGPASSAHETGMNRLVHDKLTAAEALWTLERAADRNVAYPRERLEQAQDRMIHYDEHTWGASCSIDRPQSEETRVQWAWKAACAQDAHQQTEALFEEALGRLSKRIPPAGPHSIAVWNTLTWPRTDVVELRLAGTPLEAAAGLEVLDARTGQRVQVQMGEDKTACFVARDVPALSYAVYAMKAVPLVGAGPLEGATLENDFYRVEFDAGDGRWRRWYDKELKRELADAAAPYALNQPLFETTVGPRAIIDRKQPVEFRRTPAPKSRRVSASAGPVFAEYVSETSLPTCPRILQRVRLYNELKCVDVSSVFEKQENFEPEGIYLAFPFQVPSPEFHVEIADGSMRPGKDQLTYTCYDFYSIQHWARIAGDGFGITFAPLEAPLVVLSDLNVYKWADKIDFNKGHLYSLVMNNYWTTNFKAGQSGRLTFRYRLSSQAGAHDAVRAVQSSWQPFYPLAVAWLKGSSAAKPPAAPSPLRMDGDPCLVSCVKVAEDGKGIVVRMLEVRGAPARCRVSMSLPGGRIERAARADVVERPIRDLPVADGGVTVELAANEIVTLRIVPAGW